MSIIRRHDLNLESVKPSYRELWTVGGVTRDPGRRSYTELDGVKVGGLVRKETGGKPSSVEI